MSRAHPLVTCLVALGRLPQRGGEHVGGGAVLLAWHGQQGCGRQQFEDKQHLFTEVILGTTAQVVDGLARAFDSVTHRR
jgi:hypothetical protein